MDTKNEEILNNIIDDENYDFEIIQEWENQQEKIDKLYKETKDYGRIEFVRKIYELEEQIKVEKERFRIRSKSYNDVLLENTNIKEKQNKYDEVIKKVSDLLEYFYIGNKNYPDSQRAFERLLGILKEIE